MRTTFAADATKRRALDRRARRDMGHGRKVSR